MRKFVLVALLGAGVAAAQAPSVQQRFDTARAKLEADDAAGALAELEALEAQLKSQVRPNATNLAVTRAQQAEALIKLGRADQARTLLKAVLAGPDLAKPALKPAREQALLLLAGIQEGGLDHQGANISYRQLAEISGEPIVRTLALMGAARTAMFRHPPAAIAHVDRALAIAEQDLAVGKRELANVLGLKGRILLNAGDNVQARALLTRAVSLRGGLTQKVN
jgi:hypothetical protein